MKTVGKWAFMGTMFPPGTVSSVAPGTAWNSSSKAPDDPRGSRNGDVDMPANTLPSPSSALDSVEGSPR